MTRPLDHDDLYALAMPSDPQLSRDGRWAAWVVTTADREADSYRSAIWIADLSADAAPRLLTQGAGEASPRFSPDGGSLAFVAARDGDAPQVFVLPLDGGEARRVTQMETGVGSFAWSPDGTALAVTSVLPLEPAVDENAPVVIDRLGFKADGAGLIRGRRSQLYVVPVDGGVVPRAQEEGAPRAQEGAPRAQEGAPRAQEEGAPREQEDGVRRITDDEFSYGGPVWSPDGKSLAVATSTADDRDRWPTSVVRVISLADGSARPVTPERALWDVVDWSADGSTLLLAGNPDDPGGMTRLATVAAGGGEPKMLVADLDRNVMVGGPGYPGGKPSFVDDGVVFCVRDRGATHVLRKVGDAAPTPLVTGARSVSGLACAAGSYAAIVADASTPGEVVVGSLDGGEPRTLTSLFADALPDVELVVPEEREFTAADSTSVHGWVLRASATTGAAPTLLDIHGGPHNAWGPTFDGVHLYHQVLAAKGWNVVYVNPRASDGYGQAFWNVNRGTWGVGDAQDFHAALDALIDEGVADAKRLAVTGYSYGGYMTCWLSATSDRFAAAVPGGAIVDMTSTAGTSDMGHFLAAFEFGGAPHEKPDLLAQQSPLTHVGSVNTPTLVLHGDADDRCPVGEAEQWFTALRVRGVPAQLVRYPGGSHLFILNGTPSHRVDYGQRLVSWIEEHTQPSK